MKYKLKIYKKFQQNRIINISLLNQQEMIVQNCGEIMPGEDWNFCDADRSGDKLPPFPEDWDQKKKNFSVL